MVLKKYSKSHYGNMQNNGYEKKTKIHDKYVFIYDVPIYFN